MCEKLIIPPKFIKKSADHLYSEIDNFKTWKEVLGIFKLFSDEWVFRGQKNSLWGLVPSINRFMETADPDSFEQILIEIAKDKVSDEKDQYEFPKSELGWLAFIQHYGGTTRLLDFTKDPYIATFFALNQDNGQELEQECAVWAVNKRWLEKKAQYKIKQNLDCKIENNDFSGIFKTMIQTDKFFPMIYPFVVDWDDLRIKSQESVFLCQCDPTMSFEDNLYYDQNGQDPTNPDIDYDEILLYVKKISISLSFKSDILKTLEDKNINNSTMLPGVNKFQDFVNIINQIEKDAKQRQKELLEEIRKKREI